MTNSEKLNEALSDKGYSTSSDYSYWLYDSGLEPTEPFDTSNQSKLDKAINAITVYLLNLDSAPNNIDRLKLELNYQTYYNDVDYYHFLIENSLEPTATYSKADNQAQLLQTVIDILESLCNNIDYFRKVQTEFTTTTDAYKWLKDRINQIERKLATLTYDEPKASNITFMYHN